MRMMTNHDNIDTMKERAKAEDMEKAAQETAARPKRKKRNRLDVDCAFVWNLVAGTGFEPVTFGL